MAGKLVTVSRLVETEEIRSLVGSGTLLKYIRSLVKDIRKQEPDLVQYQLYDIGINRDESGMEINLYFFS